jgi:hypothetical protein
MSWGKRIIRGTEYDLTHLDSAVIDVTPLAAGAPTYRVLVSYGCHCFARELCAGDHPDFHIPDNGNVRCLCPIRAEQSKHLPRIVREAAGASAFFSQGANMLLVEELPGLKGPYAVFFNARQSDQPSLDVVMFVASAYEKIALPDRLPAVPFTALIAKAAKGHTPFRPERTKLWSKKKK